MAAAAEVARLAREIEADPGAADRRERAAQVSAAADSEARVAAAQAAAETLEAARAARAGRDRKRGRGRSGDGSGAPGGGAEPGAETGPAAQEARASTTDPEARVMKMADGGWRPAYNAQIVSDTATGLFVGVRSRHRLDMGQLRRSATRGRAAAVDVPARGGFAKLDDIQASTVLVFWWINLIKVPAYIEVGMLNRGLLVPILILAPIAVAGVFAGSGRTRGCRTGSSSR